MSKRSREAASAKSDAAARPFWGGVVPANWDGNGNDENRDRSYVKKVRPQSDNQRALLAALKEKSLTLTLGPAGTGKTSKSWR